MNYWSTWTNSAHPKKHLHHSWVVLLLYIYIYLHMYRYIHFHIHSKYSFNAQILSSLEVDPLSLLGDAVVIFQADLHTVHLEDFLKKRWGIKQGPHFFLLAPPEKKPGANVFFITKEENIQLKSFFFKKTNTIFLLEEMEVVIIPKVEGTFPFSMGGCLGFFVDNGSKGNLCKKSCIFLLMKLSSCFFC